MIERSVLFVGALAASLVPACGGKSEARTAQKTPYDGDLTVVVGDEREGTREFATPDGDACLPLADGTCVRPQDECGDSGTADVVVDENGNVLDIICYGQDVTVEGVGIDEVPTANAGNNTVLVLDGQDDGVDVAGDLTIDGNNAIVYGEGPDTSVVGGDLKIEKNNAKVRGIRIQGDVTIDKNNTKLLFCVIEGDLTITFNNTTIAECDVYGKVEITGENTVLVNNRFNGIDDISGPNNLECNGNVRFDDANEDFVVGDGELGGPVTCNGEGPAASGGGSGAASADGGMASPGAPGRP